MRPSSLITYLRDRSVAKADPEFERKHPRGADGRFIRVGDLVHVRTMEGNQLGRVIAMRQDGRVRIELNSGKTLASLPSQVTQATAVPKQYERYVDSTSDPAVTPHVIAALAALEEAGIDLRKLIGTKPIRFTQDVSTPKTRGTYWKDERKVGVNISGPHPALTVLHELGHHYDFAQIGARGKGYATDGGGNSPLQRNLFSLIAHNTSAVKEIERHYVGSDPGTDERVTKFARYLGSPREIWARAFTQHVASRAHSTEQVALEWANTPRVAQSAVVPWPTQWEDDDFQRLDEVVHNVLVEGKAASLTSAESDSFWQAYAAAKSAGPIVPPDFDARVAATMLDLDVPEWLAAEIVWVVLTGESPDEPGIIAKAGKFREQDHPRDQHGRFISTGDIITLPDGQRGTATGITSTGQVRVRVGSGATVTVDPKTVQAKESSLTGLKPATPEQRKALRIPPAWQDVLIHPEVTPDQTNPAGVKILAVGRDGKGREQRVYSSEHEMQQAAKKFERIRQLQEQLPGIDQQLEADRGDDTADALTLIRRLGLRPGSRTDTGADKQAYGASTLEAQHVSFTDRGATLHFTGKKGVDIQLETDDPDVVAILRAHAKGKQAGQPLFPSATDVKLRDYLHGIAPGYKVKDFRTHVGTATAYQSVADMDVPTDAKALQRARKEVAQRVSALLGNTPSVALASYIDPSVFGHWEASLVTKSLYAQDVPMPVAIVDRTIAALTETTSFFPPLPPGLPPDPDPDEEDNGGDTYAEPAEKDWDSHKHPRDQRGRFRDVPLPKDGVRIAGGGYADVYGTWEQAAQRLLDLRVRGVTDVRATQGRDGRVPLTPEQQEYLILVASLIFADAQLGKKSTRPWDPKRHPRDSKGRFIHIGGLVKLPGMGGTPKVVGVNADGTINVRTSSGTEIDNVAPSSVQVATPAPPTYSFEVGKRHTESLAGARRKWLKRIATDVLKDIQDDDPQKPYWEGVAAASDDAPASPKPSGGGKKGIEYVKLSTPDTFSPGDYSRLVNRYAVNVGGEKVGEIQQRKHLTPIMEGSYQVGLQHDFTAWYVYDDKGKQIPGTQRYTLGEAKLAAAEHFKPQPSGGKSPKPDVETRPITELTTARELYDELKKIVDGGGDLSKLDPHQNDVTASGEARPRVYSAIKELGPLGSPTLQLTPFLQNLKDGSSSVLDVVTRDNPDVTWGTIRRSMMDGAPRYSVSLNREYFNMGPDDGAVPYVGNFTTPDEALAAAVADQPEPRAPAPRVIKPASHTQELLFDMARGAHRVEVPDVKTNVEVRQELESAGKLPTLEDYQAKEPVEIKAKSYYWQDGTWDNDPMVKYVKSKSYWSSNDRVSMKVPNDWPDEKIGKAYQILTGNSKSVREYKQAHPEATVEDIINAVTTTDLSGNVYVTQAFRSKARERAKQKWNTRINYLIEQHRKKTGSTATPFKDIPHWATIEFHPQVWSDVHSHMEKAAPGSFVPTFHVNSVTEDSALYHRRGDGPKQGTALKDGDVVLVDNLGYYRIHPSAEGSWQASRVRLIDKTTNQTASVDQQNQALAGDHENFEWQPTPNAPQTTYLEEQLFNIASRVIHNDWVVERMQQPAPARNAVTAGRVHLDADDFVVKALEAHGAITTRNSKNIDPGYRGRGNIYAGQMLVVGAEFEPADFNAARERVTRAMKQAFDQPNAYTRIRLTEDQDGKSTWDRLAEAKTKDDIIAALNASQFQRGDIYKPDAWHDPIPALSQQAVRSTITQLEHDLEPRIKPGGKRIEYVPHAQPAQGAPTSQRGRLTIEGYTPEEATKLLQDYGLVGELEPEVPFHSVFRSERREGLVLPLHRSYVTGEAQLPRLHYLFRHGISGGDPMKRLEQIVNGGGIHSIAERYRRGIKVTSASPSGDIRSGIDHVVFVAHGNGGTVGTGAGVEFGLKPEAALRRTILMAGKDYGGMDTRYEHYRDYLNSLQRRGKEPETNIYAPASPKVRQFHINGKRANPGSAEFNIGGSIPIEDVQVIKVQNEQMAEQARELLQKALEAGRITEVPRVVVGPGAFMTELMVA